MNRQYTEKELYPSMCEWLYEYLIHKHKYDKCEVFVVNCHSVFLDSVLQKYDVLMYYPQVVGLKIEIDVLGIVKYKNKALLYFIEAKKSALTLLNLGQLLIYCKLCEPEEAFLLSPGGLGSLNKVLINLMREDLLNFGDIKMIKKIKVAKWDIDKEAIDYFTLLPKI